MVARCLYLLALDTLSMLLLAILCQRVNLFKHFVIFILKLLNLHLLVFQLHMCQFQLFQFKFECLLQRRMLPQYIFIFCLNRIWMLVFVLKWHQLFSRVGGGAFLLVQKLCIELLSLASPICRNLRKALTWKTLKCCVVNVLVEGCHC